MALGRKRLTEGSGDTDSAEIDLTPMLDVIFIMLIFFIVTASFVKESGLDLNHPPISEAPPNKNTENRNIVFSITETNEIFIQGRHIDVRSVRANVERAHAENPQIKVIIEAHPKSKTDTFILISNQAREAGVTDIALTTQP
ncbi:MAG: biopolymer transporter ExbD [Porticoccus sp.]|nr:biopolymer transporter ExbD [Porticoccus sp.]PCJ92542.1 MAG: biopolymer transporter ExbD [Porticoccaceae bacterium]